MKKPCPYYLSLMADREKWRRSEFSRARRNGFKIPKHLPAPPLVPAGFSGWKYVGLAWKSNGPVCFSSICSLDACSGWGPPKVDTAIGFWHTHYLLAIPSL